MANTRDSQEFTRQYTLIYKDMYKYAYYVLGNKEDAEDAVSNAVLDGYKEFIKLKDLGSFRGWMFTILYAKCKRRLKTYINRDVELSEELSAPIKDTDGDIDVRRAFAMLNEKERLILATVVIAGYTSIEAAERLHMNANTVRSVEKRALEKMKQYLI